MRRLRKAGLVLAVNTAAGVVPSLFLTLFRSSHSWHQLWMDLAFSLVYAHCIGTLAFLILDRAGPKLACLHPVALSVVAFLVALVSIAIIGSAIANLIFLAAGATPPHEVWRQFVFGLKIAIVITIITGAIVSGYETLSHRVHAARAEAQERQLAEERALKLASEARLSSLESRIHPHFLFNTLNSISALIREDPARAERTVERLAALLRYSLEIGRQTLVPLRQELRVVHDYLEIEKTRFGDRLRFAIDAPAEVEDFDVPPMSLQTLVENSIKHAIAANRHGGEIRVGALLHEGSLVLSVSDDGPGFDLRSLKEGHGLENLQERLAALFSGDGRLEIARREGRMVVSIALPQKKVAV